MMAQTRTFRNLAGVQDIITDEVLQIELGTAGIEAVRLPLYVPGEVRTKFIGAISGTGWNFKRAWYYWIAKGPGIPPEDAQNLWLSHGKEVRTDGHCGCPSPLEWCKGFAVGLYHVDTQEGLNALADTIRNIRDRNIPASH